MSVQPAYAAVPAAPVVNFSTANTGRDGTGTIATLIVGQRAGTRIERVVLKAVGTTTAGMIRIFKRDSGITRAADGSIASYAAATWRLVGEVAVSAITPSATVASWADVWVPTNGLTIGDGEMLGVATHNAEAFNALVQGGQI